jgi:large subunit ribosomal protein L31e
MAKLERIYTIPLGEAYEASRNKRVPRAVKMLRAFISRHMKADGERILLSGALNTFLWTRSIQKPPRRVKVRLVKDDGAIRAFLADEKVEEPKKDAKTEKKEAQKKEEHKTEHKEARKEHTEHKHDTKTGKAEHKEHKI